uniref:Retrotransposon gag domain-containing protein n=1 Tax=Lotus japonicus TaxID=34305 RepID=I3SM81_LOTJA|nr:unknown [Lotus japonicus]
MQATLLALEGKALSWFQWWERCNPRPSWEAFKVAVVRRFQPAMMQNPFELLLSLKQTDTVEVFVEEFEKYVGALRDRSRFCQGNLLEWLEGGDSCRGKTLWIDYFNFSNSKSFNDRTEESGFTKSYSQP